MNFSMARAAQHSGRVQRLHPWKVPLVLKLNLVQLRPYRRTKVPGYARYGTYFLAL
eukprot:SAG11_NODE_13959_length_631_cov_1.176692_2_plen_55_part_01